MRSCEWRINQLVADSLVVSFVVVMLDELLQRKRAKQGAAQRT